MKSFSEYRQATGEYGVVEELRHPLALVRGLPGATAGEVVVFESENFGQVTALHHEQVEIMVLTKKKISPGEKVARTGQLLSIKIHDELLGHAIDPLGQSLFPDRPLSLQSAGEERLIDIAPPHINTRVNIKRPLTTGTSIIDLILTLGKGQREAVLGDPTTGKNSFLLTTTYAHAQEGGIVIYAAIGKPWNDIKKVYNFIDQKMNNKNVLLVATSAEDIPSLIILTPFTAMTLAEYWRDAGKDVLVIMDDLSTHARFYREISLLAHRFPARESYPGDMFYLHARLLERAGNFSHATQKESSITCLPVAETVRGDVTGYIASNLISITDGHLLFDEAVFSQGRRPAINIPLSVTRVGGHTRNQLMRELHRKLIALLAKHEEAQKFTHFGAELHESMQRVLDAGDRLNDFLSQPLFATIPNQVQIIMAGLIWLGWLNNLKPSEVAAYRSNLITAYQKNLAGKKLINKLATAPDLDTFVAQARERKNEIITLCQPTAISTPT